MHHLTIQISLVQYKCFTRWLLCTRALVMNPNTKSTAVRSSLWDHCCAGCRKYSYAK